MSVATLKETIKSNSAKNQHRFSSGILPIFYCLDEIPVPKKRNSTILSITFPRFSKWRSAQIIVPGCDLVLLRLLLSHWIDEMKAAQVRWELRFKPKLKTIHRSLLQQKLIELILPPQNGRTGSDHFCEWWLRLGVNFSITRRMASYHKKRGL
jgi:hypothetical protein